MKKKILIISLLLTLAAAPMTAYASEADGTSYTYDGYTYDFWGNAQDSPAAFELESVINQSNMEGMAVQGIDDVCTSADGRIFLVDTLESRINIMNAEGKLLSSIKAIRNKDGKIEMDDAGTQLILKNPEGVFVHEKNQELYIADTGAKRIIVLDSNDYSLKRVIKQPENMKGVTEFKPSKVAVDDADRIYVIVQSSYEGIIELNEDGTFSRYFGVNSPKVNLVDYFWKSIATDKQKEQMKKTFAPAFNNVAIDGEGFVFAVSYDSASKDKVFRLNSGGKNVLRQKGNTYVIGDIHYMDYSQRSKFVDVAVTKYGTYAVLDKTRGRIFLYDFDGELLNVFGSIGKVKGSSQIPSGIAWLGDKLVVTDSSLKCAYILAPTNFGKAALEASEKYYYGKWDEALVLFKDILKMNANYEIAYTGIGKNYLMKDEYKKAMYYFKLGNNRTFYSKAYNGYRAEALKNHFGIVAGIFILIIILLVWTEVRYHKKEGKVS